MVSKGHLQLIFHGKQNHGHPETSGPNPQILGLLLLYIAKKVFAVVIKSRVLRWGDYAGISQRAQCNHMGPYKGQREAEKSEKETQRWKRRSDLHFGNGTSHRPKDADSLWKLEKQGVDSLLGPPGGWKPC